MEKNNKMKISAKTIMTIFIIALVSVFCIFGLSKAFAEPTIYDLVEEPERIGNFEPNRLVQDDDEMYVSAWLNVNNLMFSYDYWYDYDENGTVDAEDVYQQEDFENNTRMNATLLPIFRTGNEDDNFYFVPFISLQDYNNFIVMNVQLANNNDLAELKDQSLYWYDKENYVFYFDKSLIEDDIDKKEFNTLRCETNLLVKSVPEATKTIGIFTIFNENVKPQKQLEDAVPNGDFEMNLKEWDSLALQFQFVPEKHLAYISKENLDVYLNYHVLPQDAWAYDALTGVISIDADTSRTTDVVVKVKQLNEVTEAQQTLQMLQAQSESDLAQAASSVSMKDILKEPNAYLKKLTYTDAPPQVGATQKFDYMIEMAIDNGYGDTGDPVLINYCGHTLNRTDGSTYVPTTTMLDSTMDMLKKSFADKGFLQSTTISAFNTNSKEIAAEYGSVVEELMQANDKINNKVENQNHIREAIKKAEELLFTAYDEIKPSDPSGAIDFTMKVTNKWTWTYLDNHAGQYRYSYIYGSNLNNQFLGGTIAPNDGYPFFDVSCAHIAATNWAANNFQGGGVIQDGSGNFNTKVTILDVEEDKNGGGGFVYLGLWATTLDEPGTPIGNDHSQRVLAFSKVRYEYNGTGSVRFLKKDATTGANLSGAKYGIYTNAACDTKSKVAEVVSRHDAVSVELKHGTYYVKEITPPSGYTLDTTVHKITVSSGKTVELVVKDQKQTCTFTLTTIDKTTQGSGYEMPVPGITYELYDRANPTKKIATYTSDSKGKITGTVNATGEYFLKQTGTVTDYRMETNSKDADYCNRITIDARPNTSGKNFQINKKHYEKRQTVIINTPVWDENLKEHSPAELGGDEGGNVSLVNATYKLKAETPLFLGYHKGQKVTVPAGTMLTMKTYNNENSMNIGASNQAYSKKEDEKAMLRTSTLYVTSNGTNLSFSIPNGKYQWIMDGASPGYVKTDNKTTIDASWTKENSQFATLECNKTPVIQKRQTCAIDLYVKTYVEEDRVPPANGITNQPNLIKDKVYTRILDNDSAKSDNSAKPSWQKHIDMNFKKDVRSNANSFGKDTVESATLYENGKQVMAVKSSGVLAKNAVYSLQNLCNIVDVKTGKEITHGTILGYFQTDKNGKIHIETLGSDAFENPNKEFNKKTFENVVPLNNNNIGVKGNPLPNGLYGLVLNSWPTKSTDNELCISEDFVQNLQWNKNNSTNTSVQTTAVTLLLAKDTKPGSEPKVPVAPDMPPDDKTPPYDPNYPESPDNPDDSNDIPRVDIEWIDNNFGNLAYRIIDSENISGDKDNPVFEVNDKLPTTFAFYVQDNTLRDEIYHTRYYLSFYYEISAQEYEAARAEAEGQNALDEFESKLEYIKVDGKYARRFNTPNLSGGDSLTDVIAFNKLSDGWVNINEAAKNKTVSGAIYNTDWINEKLAQQADGDYNIYIYVDPVTTYESKTDGSLMEIKHASRQSGTFVIKNRQLVNLD